ncbi:gliding motility lipoprotein GldD [Myroides sp. LJL119]
MYKNTLTSYFTCIAMILLVVGCKKDTLPKPQAYLALEYPDAQYQTYTDTNAKYSFNKNTLSNIKTTANNSIEIHYPQMKATIFLNYKPIENNLNLLLSDAQKLTYEHFIKADEIIEQPFVNPTNKVTAMLYNVKGDAATNVQFYATDQRKNFLVASLYFYTTPNFDSILPAKEYLENDMKQILETLQWEQE